MTGSSYSHPFGYSARRPDAAQQRGQHRSVRVLVPFQSTTAPTMLWKTLLLVARVRRFLNGRVAAVIAHHEQGVLFAQQKPDQRRLDSTRIYRGPIDQVLAKTAGLRKRAA